MQSDVGEEMAAFDMLPPSMRDLLREAPVKVSAISVADQVLRHGPDVVAAVVRHWMGKIPSPYE